MLLKAILGTRHMSIVQRVGRVFDMQVAQLLRVCEGKILTHRLHRIRDASSLATRGFRGHWSNRSRIARALNVVEDGRGHQMETASILAVSIVFEMRVA